MPCLPAKPIQAQSNPSLQFVKDLLDPLCCLVESFLTQFQGILFTSFLFSFLLSARYSGCLFYPWLLLNVNIWEEENTPDNLLVFTTTCLHPTKWASLGLQGG